VLFLIFFFFVLSLAHEIGYDDTLEVFDIEYAKIVQKQCRITMVKNKKKQKFIKFIKFIFIDFFFFFFFFLFFFKLRRCYEMFKLNATDLKNHR
jgi:hypothetical protein